MGIRANKAGIQLEKPDIKVLRAFAGEGERFDSVHFRVSSPGANLMVNATDGHRAVECISTTEDANCVSGEWAVDREFLDTCYRALKPGQSVLLRVKRNELRVASIIDSKTLEEITAFTWPKEAASTQITMDEIARVLLIAAAARNLTGGTWYAVQGSYLADLKLITQACGRLGAITIYPPAAPADPIGFEAKGDGVRWTGVVMPVRVEAPGETVADADADPTEGDDHDEDGDDDSDEDDSDDGSLDTEASDTERPQAGEEAAAPQ